MMEALCAQPQRPVLLARKLRVSKFAVSRHLATLLEAGLVERRRSMADRRGYLYVLPPELAWEIKAWLAGTAIDKRHPTSAAFVRPSDVARRAGRLRWDDSDE